MVCLIQDFLFVVCIVQCDNPVLTSVLLYTVSIVSIRAMKSSLVGCIAFTSDWYALTILGVMNYLLWFRTMRDKDVRNGYWHTTNKVFIGRQQFTDKQIYNSTSHCLCSRVLKTLLITYTDYSHLLTAGIHLYNQHKWTLY